MGSAPAATARGTPGGLTLRDGFQSMVTFEDNATVKLFEKSTTPPGVDGGDPVETTTMHNAVYRSLGPRGLITLTEMLFTAAYDPAVYDEIIALTNVEQTITVTFADGSTLAFYGFLQKFEPGEMSEGEQPEATVSIQPTNVDPSDWSEQGPTMVEASGT